MFSGNHAKGRLAAAVLFALGAVSAAQAVDFGDMMNPGKWFGGSKDRDIPPYGPDMPPPGYGYDAPPPYGFGGAAPYGYGAPAYGGPAPGAPGAGYGAPVYGAPPPAAYGQQMPAVPGYAQPPGPGYGQAPVAPPPSGSGSDARIRELERRIQELESAQRGSQPPMGAGSMPYQQMPPYRSGPRSGMSGMSGMPATGGFRPMDQQ